MRAHLRYLHAFSGFEGVFGHLVCSHNWPPLGLESCFLRFRFSSPTVWKCFQPSVRELFVPILWLPRRCVFDGFLQEFEGFKGYVRPLWGRLSLAGWAGILLGLCRFACVPTTGTSMLLAVSKACLGPSSAATIGHPLGWNPAFCAFAFRVLPFESVSSRPYGSFSCRFCGFQEGAFSMASYRSLRGSKGTLGPCRAVCLWRVGLESCWGSAVSHACPPPVPPCF